MKQNITISVEKSLLRKARALAAQRGASISAMLAQELLRIADRESEYALARRRALARGSLPHSTSVAGSVSPGRRCMIVKTFVDSNVLIYAHDADAGSKQRIAADRLRKLWESGAGLLSTQVLQEFYVNVTRKIASPLAAGAAREVVRDYAAWIESSVTAATIVRASEISEVWRVSFWDAMILAAGEQSGAEQLLTEDLIAGEKIAGIEIVNPFSGA